MACEEWTIKKIKQVIKNSKVEYQVQEFCKQTLNWLWNWSGLSKVERWWLIFIVVFLIIFVFMCSHFLGCSHFFLSPTIWVSNLKLSFIVWWGFTINFIATSSLLEVECICTCCLEFYFEWTFNINILFKSYCQHRWRNNCSSLQGEGECVN